MCGEQLYRIHLGGLWLEAFLYGAYLLLFASYICIHIKMHPNKYLLAAAIAMFTLSTILIANDLVVLLLTPTGTTSYRYSKEIYPCPGVSASDDLYEANVGNLSDWLQILLFTVNQFVADMLLLYRCHVLWRYAKWFGLFPAVLIIATLSAGAGQTYYALQVYLIRFHNKDSSQATPPTSWIVANIMVNKLIESQVALSIASNVLLTSMIVVRIWRMLRELGYSAGSRSGAKYKSVVTTIIESGAIFTGSQLLYLVLNLLKSPTPNIMSNALNQIVGIAPTLIMVRVGLGRGIEQTVVISTRGNPTHIAAPASNEEIEMVPPGREQQTCSRNRRQTHISRGS